MAIFDVFPRGHPFALKSPQEIARERDIANAVDVFFGNWPQPLSRVTDKELLGVVAPRSHSKAMRARRKAKR